MRFSVITLHPSMIQALAAEGLLSKAQSSGAISLQTHSLREFSDPPHNRVDDKPYGGGPGMILKIEPLARAMRKATEASTPAKTRRILFSAKGRAYTQRDAETWAKDYDHLILICGRYEGVDERFRENFCDEEVRIGDFVLMGGEAAAGVVIESVARLLPGVLGNPESTVAESFSKVFEKEYPQYTRPPEFEGLAVPEVLRGGNHAEIQKWRKSIDAKTEAKTEEKAE